MHLILILKKNYIKKKSNLSNFLACARISAIIIDNYLFVHAGVLEKLIKYTAKYSGQDKMKSINVINKSIKQWLLNTDSIEDKDYISKLLSGKTLSPFWPRIFGNLPSGLDRTNKLCKHHVEPVLTFLNLKGLVVGHTPQLKTGINSTCSDKVWRVDVASSQAFDKLIKDDIKEQNEEKIKSARTPQVLEIILGNDNISDIFNIIKME